MPNQRDCPDLLWQIQAEAERLMSPPHGQDEPFALAGDRLGRPLHRHIVLGFIRVVHAGMGRLELPGGFYIGEELVTDHLNALGVQRELSAFGVLLQRIAIRPGLVPQPGVLMALATVVPHPSGFHLGGPQALSRWRGKSFESIDTYGFHIRS
jgi:hypothetical protein